jgi:hypothetical protein
MSKTILVAVTFALGVILSSLLPERAAAHEVFPSVADMAEADGVLTFTVAANLESFVAGIDLQGLTNTNNAPEAADYDALRALPPADLQARFEAFWPEMAGRITVRADEAAIAPELVSVTIPDVGDPDVPRASVLTFRAALPAGATAVTVGWDAAFGGLLLRQTGVPAPFTGLLEGGALSDPIPLAGGGAAGGWETFFDYIPVGFDHIVPKGLDHILFVLGLFFLSTRMGPLLWQVSAFTVAHTITLALAALNIVRIPGEIVEPLIAASIVFVAVENIFTQGLSRWRPVVVFVFGLLHGLGFASVLADFGLPEDNFIPALLGFNVGVEVGQLTVIAVAFLLVGYWFGQKDWYRSRIAIPASALIAIVGAYWFVERVFL